MQSVSAEMPVSMQILHRLIYTGTYVVKLVKHIRVINIYIKIIQTLDNEMKRAKKTTVMIVISQHKVILTKIVNMQ